MEVDSRGPGSKKGLRAGRVVAVGGGKGGVGKSLVAANLAIAMAQSGRRVVLVDGDLGSANQHTMFGIDRPGRCLHDLLEGDVRCLGDVAIETPQPNLSLVAGSSGVLGAANVGYRQKLKLLRHIRSLDADVVVVDVGAGVSFNTLDLFDVADLRLVVMTPQLTAVQNAYAFLKSALYRAVARFADGREQRGRAVDAARTGSSVERIDSLIARLREQDPELAARLLALVANYGARLVGNYVMDRRETGTFHAMSRMIRDYLGVDANVVAALTASRSMHAAINDRVPLLLGGARDENALAFRRMARVLLAEDVRGLREARETAGLVVAARACAETGGSFPEQFQRIQRRSDRQPVEWSGWLIRGDARVACRVFDVSDHGVGFHTEAALQVGDRWSLLLDGGEETLLPVVVRHVQPSSGRAGAELEVDARDARAVFLEVDAAIAGRPDTTLM